MYNFLLLFFTQHSYFKINLCWDFLDGPVVKTSPSNVGGAGLIPGWGAKIAHASGPKNQNIKQRRHCNKFSKRL